MSIKLQCLHYRVAAVTVENRLLALFRMFIYMPSPSLPWRIHLQRPCCHFPPGSSGHNPYQSTRDSPTFPNHFNFISRTRLFSSAAPREGSLSQVLVSSVHSPGTRFLDLRGTAEWLPHLREFAKGEVTSYMIKLSWLNLHLRRRRSS